MNTCNSKKHSINNKITEIQNSNYCVASFDLKIFVFKSVSALSLADQCWTKSGPQYLNPLNKSLCSFILLYHQHTCIFCLFFCLWQGNLLSLQRLWQRSRSVQWQNKEYTNYHWVILLITANKWTVWNLFTGSTNGMKWNKNMNCVKLFSVK